MIEIWKDIIGYEGIYQISNYGRIKSFKLIDSGYILSNQNKKGDYLKIVLSDTSLNKRSSASIHKLVYTHFIGEIPKGFQVHHKDGNKQNNKSDNLDCIHPVSHRKETIRKSPAVITKLVSYNKYLGHKRVQQFTPDGYFIAEYANASIASKITGICGRNILQVANKEEYKPGMIRKQAGGYAWKLKEGD